MDKLSVTTLGLKDLSKMHEAFLKAFSDYPLPFNFTREEFCIKFVEKLNINFNLSPAAFEDRRIVAFIFTSIAGYDGQPTAYNGGTGVIPDFRGQRLTSRLYQFIKPKLRRQGIRQCVLEVLTNNHRAIRAYREIGFEKSRYFKCFKLLSDSKLKRALIEGIKISRCLEPDWDLFGNFDDFSTSFLDSWPLLQKNFKNEVIITAEYDDRLIGYAVYQNNGRISRLGVHHGYRNQGVGTALVNYAYRDCGVGELTILNINRDYEPIIRFFTGLGFINEVNQYELKLKL